MLNLQPLFSCTVINAFGGLIIFRAIAGNITSYSREIYGQLKFPAIAQFFPSYSWELSQLCFPCNCWYISQVQPGYCPRFNLGICTRVNLGIVPGSTSELSQETALLCQKQAFEMALQSALWSWSPCLESKTRALSNS